MTTRTAFSLLFLFSLAGAAVAGTDDPKTLQAKAAIEVFRKEFAGESLDRRMQALWDLARVGHELTIEEVCRTALVDPDPQVRGAAAMALGRAGAKPEVAGPRLRDELLKNEDEPEVQVAIVRAIGDLGYLDARDALIEAAMRFLEEEYRHVTNEVMRTFGRLKDGKALPFLLQLLEYEGQTLRGRKGPVVRGKNDADAKRIYDAKYKRFAYPKGTPEFVIRWWMQELVAAVHEITGEEFTEAEGLRGWMEENARKQGFTSADLRRKRLVPKKPKKAPEEEEE